MHKAKACQKVFISYSHDDELFLTDFKKHISILQQKELLTIWTDQEIIVGNPDMFNEIDNRLQNSDIVCLFLSSDYLSSNECQKEKIKALKEDKIIIPVVLRECLWDKDVAISNKPAATKDGVPIASYTDKDKAWVEVCESLIKLLDILQKRIENDNNFYDNQEKKEGEYVILKNKPKFLDILNDAGIISKLHPNKERVFLDDIFVYPRLCSSSIDELKSDELIYSDKIIDELKKCNRIIISGDTQSGKTALSKKIYTLLKSNNFVPVLIEAKTASIQGDFQKRIQEIFKLQYVANDVDFNQYKKDIVPIIDDFHTIKSKTIRERLITELCGFTNSILFVDDIFNVSFRNAPLTSSYKQLVIKTFVPSQRDKLIGKWLALSDKVLESPSDLYKEIDKEKEIIDKTIGKSFGKGLMPPYPFFILSILASYETVKNLNQNITSQGYCYHLLILMSLNNQNVKSQQIDTYMNFLSILAYHFYKEHKENITREELEKFVLSYSQQYNFDERDKDKIINTIIAARLLNKNIVGMYSFKFPYVYYYFIAKYFADNFNENKTIIDNMIMNLHKDEYAYIIIFISHHIKNNDLFDELQINTMYLFDKVKPATLSKDEISFLDDKIKDILIKLPSHNASHENERKRELAVEDAMEEETKEDIHPREETDDDDKDEYTRELRRAFRTVDVVGQIIKDRSGSIEKVRLDDMFEEAMNVILRNLTYFFNLIKDKRSEDALVEYISIAMKTNANDKDITNDERNKQARDLFWHLNFMVTNSSIHRIINSLCSDNLRETIERIDKKIATHATFLVKHGALLRYGKIFNYDEIEKYVKSKFCATTVKKIIAIMVTRHYMTNPLTYWLRLKIADMFDIKKPQDLLIAKERIQEASKKI